MKHLKVAFLALLLVTGFSTLQAQDENNPWALGFGVNAVDFYPTNSGLPGHGGWFDEFVNVSDHWNMLPAIDRLSVGRYLADGFSFQLVGSFNRIDKIGDNAVDDLAYWSLDGEVKWNVSSVVSLGKLNPYLLIGGGYTWLDDADTGTFNGGVGVEYWFNEKVALNLETKLKKTFESQIGDHFQWSAGIVFKMGGTDTDGDGIFDKKDECPEVFGLAEFNGCPDTDSDGIKDSEDACPEVFGLAEFNGCPDADGDGIIDKEDDCPKVKGTKANKGCPDTDNDGLIDKKDNCPKVAGPKENKGCPWPDTDGDSVVDKDDNCPKLAGLASNNGCPAISEKEVEELNVLFKAVYFKFNSTELTNDAINSLNASTNIISKYPADEFSLSGHTDSIGSEKTNLEISEERVNVVKDYLISKGVSSSKLTAKGYGESKPIATNNTAKGRDENRRVEIKVKK